MEQENQQQEQKPKVVQMTLGELEERQKQISGKDKFYRKQDGSEEEKQLSQDNKDEIKKLSKSQLKKRKNRGRRTITEEKKEEIKQTRLERKKLKKALEQTLKNMNQVGGEENQNEKDGKFNENYKSKKQIKEEYMEKFKSAPTVVVDFQFVDQIMERDRASLMKQVEVCYALNKKAENPLKLTCAQGDHKLMQPYIEQRSCKHWGVDFEPKDILEKYKKEDIIYMSGDVNVDMDEYEPDKVYIIGGLVEHNRLVNLTKDYCEKNGIKARRLPLSRYLGLRACSLLNINHVFQILLCLHNGESWEQAIKKSVPSRKVGEVYFDSDEEEQQQQQQDQQQNQVEDNKQQQQDDKQ